MKHDVLPCYESHIAAASLIPSVWILRDGLHDHCTDSLCSPGQIMIGSGVATAGASGSLVFSSGSGAATGAVSLVTGTSFGGGTGAILLSTGSSTAAAAGVARCCVYTCLFVFVRFLLDEIVVRCVVHVLSTQLVCTRRCALLFLFAEPFSNIVWFLLAGCLLGQQRACLVRFCSALARPLQPRADLSASPPELQSQCACDVIPGVSTIYSECVGV